MEYLRQIEDDIKNIATEAKSKFPLVKEASDKAIVSLKVIRDGYVSDIMKRSNDEKSTKFPQSSDILAPFMLACNYSDCTTKLINMAMNGIHMLLNYGMIPPGDIKNILRVLSIQASSPKFDLQLKLLQIVLHMANSLSHNPESSQYLTESTICSFITLSLQVCEGKGNASVSNAAHSTVRQLIGMVMDGALSVFNLKHKREYITMSSLHLGVDLLEVSIDQSSASFAISARLLLRDLALFMQGQPGDWIRGASMSQQTALDFVYEVLHGWQELFVRVGSFKDMLRDTVVPALKPLLRNLQEDFLAEAMRAGLTNAAAFTSRVVRVARCLLLDHCSPELYEDADHILTLLVHSLQPDRGLGGPSESFQHNNVKGGSSPRVPNSSAGAAAEDPTFRSRFEDASAALLNPGTFISRLTLPMNMAAGAINNLKQLGVVPSKASFASLSSIPGLYITLSSGASHIHSAGPPSASPSSTGSTQMPAHPAAMCLETLLSFLVCCQQYSQVRSEQGLHLLEMLLSNVSVSVSGLLLSALSVDTNARDFDAGLKSSPLQPLLKVLLSGDASSAANSKAAAGVAIDRKTPAVDAIEEAIRCINEYFMGGAGARPMDVFVLAFALLQYVPRVVLREALLVALYSPLSSSEQQQKQIQGSVFLSPSLRSVLPMTKEQLPAYLEMAPRIRQSLARVCELTYESTLDACSLLLNSLENAAVIRATLGAVAELAVCVGIVGLVKPCEIVLSVLCRYTVPMWHGQELYSAALDSRQQFASGGVVSPPQETIRWRHIQAIVRLLQVVHTIADVISDWDSIVDCIEQLVDHFRLAPSAALPTAGGGAGGRHEVTALEVDKILAAVERFKLYSVFLSDDALVKLMTSLVALSMNNLAVNATSHPLLSISGSGDRQQQYGNSSEIGRKGSSENQARLKVLAGAPEYIVNGIRSGSLSFSLQSVIEIAKLNAFRVSAVWQMVTSHLRMIASLKSSQSRMLAVAATHDVIETSLRYIQNPVSPIAALTFMKEDVALRTQPAAVVSGGHGLLSEDAVFNQVLPNFETVFVGRDFHRTLSFARNQVLLYIPKLSQSDLLSSLRALATVRYSDVRNAILAGLSDMLQKRGQNIDEGSWLVLLDILESVPASMSTENFLSECYSEDADELAPIPLEAFPTLIGGLSTPGKTASAASSVQSPSLPQYQWPAESLRLSFSCMQLVVEDFLDKVLSNAEIVRGVLQCLSVFSSQLKEINVSLTSVELLWKVTDLAIKKASADPSAAVGSAKEDNAVKGRAYVESVFDAMLKRLFQLSMDTRPEIRHCAIDTLFLAMAAHTQIISSTQWRQVFEKIVFPLFTRTGARSQEAMRSNEEATAPELKKGVKMNVHHSRDTAHKQWSETRVKALQGLTKVLKTCAALLLQETWFREAWTDSISVCHGAFQSACEDQEVAIAGLEVLVSMLKIVIALDETPTSAAAVSSVAGVPKADPRRQSKTAVSESEMRDLIQRSGSVNVERAKEQLWNLAWTALHDAAFFSCASVDLAFGIAQKLAELYKNRMAHEFRYSDNMRVLLEIVVTLARPRLAVNGVALDSVSVKQNRVAEGQLHRCLMDLLRAIQPANDIVFALLLSATAEISFASQMVQVVSPMTGELVLFGAAPEKLRREAGEHLLLIQKGPSAELPKEDPDVSPSAHKYRMSYSSASAPYVMLDVVTKRFLSDLCASPLSLRTTNSPFIAAAVKVSSSASIEHSPVRGGSKGAAEKERDAEGGFFSSFASMMSPSANPATTAVTSSNHGSHQEQHAVSPNKGVGGQVLHLFNAYSPCDAELGQQVLRCSGLGDSEWCSFYALEAETSVLLGALEACVHTAGATPSAGSDKLTDSVWEQVLTCMSCLLVPWRASELLLRLSVSASETEFSSTAGNVSAALDCLLRLSGSSSRRTLQLVKLLSHAVVLSVFCVSRSEVGSGAIADCLDLWRKAKSVMCSVATSSSASMERKKHALQQVIWTTKQMCVLISTHTHSFLPSEVFAVCTEYLQSVTQISVPLQLVSLGSDACNVNSALLGSNDTEVVDALLGAWWTATAVSRDAGVSCEEESPSVLPDSSPARRGSESSTPLKRQPSSRATEVATSEKTHLLLLMSSAVSLVVSCKDSALREAAASLIWTVDTEDMLRSMGALAARNSELETQNRLLTIELMSVKSAASLPF